MSEGIYKNKDEVSTDNRRIFKIGDQHEKTNY